MLGHVIRDGDRYTPLMLANLARQERSVSDRPLTVG